MNCAPAYDLTTLGETMLRISVPPGTVLETAGSAALHAGGAESNVACALARLGRRTAWASRLPQLPTGRLIANALRQCGVDLSLVEWCPAGRVGTYYVELRLPPSPARVTYDRTGSCAANLDPDRLPLDALLDTRLLHLTGITPALSEGCCQALARLTGEARARGVPFSFDLNYRRKLWSPAAARKALPMIARGTALLFAGASDAAEVFGFSGDPEQVIASLRETFEAQQVVLTVGAEGVVAWDGRDIRRHSAQDTAVIDRIGAGDALAAGVIHGWLDGDFTAGLRYGQALAALALRTDGDIVVVTPDELDELVAGSGPRPQR
ncbi:MAG: sugar kinase [Lentisphaerae bacterium]|jgi:2-dehydro-3-deoxygluconokinase|nr:sugar kinase [Lentisphaerota bacterium]